MNNYQKMLNTYIITDRHYTCTNGKKWGIKFQNQFLTPYGQWSSVFFDSIKDIYLSHRSSLQN